MPEGLQSLELPSEWFLLLLRVLFIFLIYFFLYQLFRVQLREVFLLATEGPSRTDVAPPHRLVVMEGGDNPHLVGQTFLLRQTNSLGRSDRNSIALDEPFISTEHANLSWSGGTWWVTDNGSTNGTFVNDLQVRGSAGVNPGDVVQFGRVKLQLMA